MTGESVVPFRRLKGKGWNVWWSRCQSLWLVRLCVYPGNFADGQWRVMPLDYAHTMRSQEIFCVREIRRRINVCGIPSVRVEWIKSFSLSLLKPERFLAPTNSLHRSWPVFIPKPRSDSISQVIKLIFPKMSDQPLVTHLFTVDPSAHVFNGKLYLYPSHDVKTDIEDNDNGDQYAMTDYHVFSLDRMGGEVTDHGVALKAEDIPWVSKQLWAPDAATKNGKYYLY